MSGLTPRQALIEVLNDYKYNVKMGMEPGQALDVLKAQTVDLIEYEKDKVIETGQRQGKIGLKNDLWLAAVKLGLTSEFERLMKELNT